MKKIFFEVDSLDKKCYEKYHLSEDILMEHASLAMAKFIRKNFAKKSSVLIVCGSGNNGADGIALGRLLYKEYKVFLYIPFELKSTMAKIQYKRANALGVKEITQLQNSDVFVDCLFGSGLNKNLNEDSQKIIDGLNSFDGYKIACDIPSGLNKSGEILSSCFKANTTISMGAYKLGLFSDIAKDFVGEIKITNLGVPKRSYEESTNYFLLQKEDMLLPNREIKNTHKGKFGHLGVVVGEKQGAGILSCLAAFSFGCSLVSAISKDEIALPHHVMKFAKNIESINTIALGMGLGNYNQDEIKTLLSLDIPKVIDADLFYDRLVLETLDKNCVLTPHPKEFCSILKICGIVDISVEKLQQNRFKYAEIFSKNYPNTILYLKGANSIIAQQGVLYINKFGSSKLSKGGSGDVLSGLIASLLAQGYNALQATITASLAHSLAANKVKKSSYALKPQDIIKEIERLKVKQKPNKRVS